MEIPKRKALNESSLQRKLFFCLGGRHTLWTRRTGDSEVLDGSTASLHMSIKEKRSARQITRLMINFAVVSFDVRPYILDTGEGSCQVMTTWCRWWWVGWDIEGGGLRVLVNPNTRRTQERLASAPVFRITLKHFLFLCKDKELQRVEWNDSYWCAQLWPDPSSLKH